MKSVDEKARTYWVFEADHAYGTWYPGYEKERPDECLEVIEKSYADRLELENKILREQRNMYFDKWDGYACEYGFNGEAERNKMDEEIKAALAKEGKDV